MLKFAKSGLDLITISSVTSYWNEWPRLIWPTLYMYKVAHKNVAV